MRHTTVIGAAALAAFLAVPGLLAGQSGAPDPTGAHWRPDTGDRSIAFSLPEAGSGVFGLWWHRSRGWAFGLELGASAAASLRTGGADPDQLGSSVSLSVGPALKRYRGSLGPVAPYFLAGLGVSGSIQYSAVDVPGTDPVARWGVGGYVRMAGGVDWFVAERVSIGGHVGGRVGYGFQPARSDKAEPDRHSLTLGTFTSGLTLHIYF